MKKFNLLIICSIFLLSCKNPGEKSQGETNQVDEAINIQIANANGFEEFENVKQISFTFNVKVNDTLRSERAWKWFPQEDRVELTEKGETLSYLNDGELTEEEQGIDRKFINDSYWLLFPYQLIWSDFDMERVSTSQAPISGDQMEQLSIFFSDNGGYTPGDTYHIFFGDDKLIREWTYVSSGGRTMSTTWEDYETYEGIPVSTMHKSEDGSFQLFFTDIEIVK